MCGVLQHVCLATVRQEVKAKNHKMENKKVKDSKKKERLTTLVQVNTQSTQSTFTKRASECLRNGICCRLAPVTV